MPDLRTTAATLILAGVLASSAGCGDDEDKTSSKSKGESQKSKEEAAVMASALTDMEQYIPNDLNSQLRKAGQDFRVRSIRCARQESTFTATCVLRGSGDRSYDVKVNVERSDGSYTYNCPKCP